MNDLGCRETGSNLLTRSAGHQARFWLIAASCVVLPFVNAEEAVDRNDQMDAARPAPDHVPDLREEKLAVKLQKRNWFIVPIPVSNPTTDTGLVIGGAYFHRQTEAKKKEQPPSVTGAGGYYSSNDSAAFAIGHQSYWSSNKWRFSGVIVYADLNLKLSAPDVGGATSIDWSVKGDLFAAIISRRLGGKWYGGVFARYVDVRQEFGVDASTLQFDTSDDAVSGGLGVKLQRDSRDKPFNSRAGSIFALSGLVNGDDLGSDNSYTSYSASYRSYHSLSSSVVLAWEVQGCHRSGQTPLWDACRIDLRGFPVTDYLGKSSASGQVEARWQFHPKWGGVAFAGSGYYKNSFSEVREQELIPSYGIGLRYMVLSSQRINMRLDYARSKNSSAVYLSVSEAF